MFAFEYPPTATHSQRKTELGFECEETTRRTMHIYHCCLHLRFTHSLYSFTVLDWNITISFWVGGEHYVRVDMGCFLNLMLLGGGHGARKSVRNIQLFRNGMDGWVSEWLTVGMDGVPIHRIVGVRYRSEGPMNRKAHRSVGRWSLLMVAVGWK